MAVPRDREGGGYASRRLPVGRRSVSGPSGPMISETRRDHVVTVGVDIVAGKKELINFELPLPGGQDPLARRLNLEPAALYANLAEGLQAIWDGIGEDARKGLRASYSEQKIVSFQGLDPARIAILGEVTLARKRAMAEDKGHAGPV